MGFGLLLLNDLVYLTGGSRVTRPEAYSSSCRGPLLSPPAGCFMPGYGPCLRFGPSPDYAMAIGFLCPPMVLLRPYVFGVGYAVGTP